MSIIKKIITFHEHFGEIDHNNGGKVGKGASLNECANDWLGTWRRKEGFVLYNYHC